MSDFAKDKKENYPSYQQQLAQQAQADYNFAEDKAKNYPSIGVAEEQPVVEQQQAGTTPVVVDGQQAVGTVTTGQEQQSATTPVVAPQQPVSTAVPAGNGGLAATESQQTGQAGPTGQAGGQAGGVRQEDYTFTEGQLAQMGPALEPEKPKYLAEWTPNSNVYEEAKRLNIPLQQALADYWRWGKDTGNPTSWIDYAYQDMDLSKTPEEIEKEQKRQERKERWDKVGNFLLHLGNVIGNQAGGGYGALKLEDPIKYTERQRLLKEKTMERRRAYNQSYFARMRQEDADRRRAEMERAKNDNEKRKLDRLDEDQRLKNRKQEWLEKYQQGILDDKAERRRIDEDYKNKRISLEERNTQIRELNAFTNSYRAHHPASSQAKETTKTTEKVDDFGGKTTTTTTTRTGPVGSTSSQNTPPSRRNTSTTSRRNSSTTSNTPPSRRR